MAASNQPSPGGTESLPEILKDRDYGNPEDYQDLFRRYQELYQQGAHEGEEGAAIKAWLKERAKRLKPPPPPPNQ